MRSLRLKLILAFMLTGFIGTTLVAVFVGVQTRAGFNEYLASFEAEEGEDEEDESPAEEALEHLLSPEDTFLQGIVGTVVLGAVLAAAVAFVVGLLFARSLSEPVLALTHATEAIAAGELGHRISVRSKDEIGQLADSFNQMSDELAHATDLRKRMTADIAHDLRTPLSILSGYTEGLKDGAVAPTEELYGIMYGEVQHLTHLVEDLRLLSLADAGELTLNLRPVDPKALLEKTALAYILQAEQKGLALRVEAVADLPSIEVDIARMTQVLNNLVANALRHTTTGEIVLSAHVEKNGVFLAVQDTGAGITPAALPFIFDRFYRADPSRHRAEDGTSGLGLAIAKSIVTALGGTIVVDSELGEGTRFVIRFGMGKL